MQQLAYMQMLRAGAFAATAFEAVARLSVAFCVDLIIVILTIPPAMYLHCIQAGEEVRNADVLRTSFDAVADGSFALPLKVDARGIIGISGITVSVQRYRTAVAAPHSYFFSENVMLTSPSPSSERRVSSSVFCIFPRRVRLYMFSP